MLIIISTHALFFLAPSVTDSTTTTTTAITTTTTAKPTVFQAVQSGSFSDSATWLGGIVPSGRCSITISASVVVTFTGATLDIDLQTLSIDGTFTIVSTGNVGFTFTSAVKVVVSKGASLKDQTDNHQIYCLAGSAFTFKAGGSFTGSSTKVSVYKSVPASGSLGASFSFGSSLSGPFTFGVLLDGSIKTFGRVAFIADQTGSFSDDSTWLGGAAPTSDVCSSEDCELFTAPGVSLSTEKLGGSLSIKFSVITISASATLKLGALGLSAGFRFRSRVLISCFGTLQDVTGSAGGIFLTAGSNLNIESGGKFTNDVPTFLYVFNPDTDATIGSGLALSVSVSGPYFASVSLAGDISISTSSKRENTEGDAYHHIGTCFVLFSTLSHRLHHDDHYCDHHQYCDYYHYYDYHHNNRQTDCLPSCQVWLIQRFGHLVRRSRPLWQMLHHHRCQCRRHVHRCHSRC